MINKDSMVFDSDRTGNFEIYTMIVNPQPARNTIRALTNDPTYDSWWARISPDRQTILFYRTPRGVHDSDYSQTSLWLMSADGSSPRMLRRVGADGWGLQGHGEWVQTAQGPRILTFGGSGSNPQIYLLNATTGSVERQITDRGGVSLDPSWSPADPSNLLFIGCPPALPPLPPGFCLEWNYEVYRIPLTGGTASQLTTNGNRDQDPYTSNLGGRIAWTQLTDPTANGGHGSWNIMLMNSNGNNQINLTANTGISTVPQWSWSPDDQWIYFHGIVKRDQQPLGNHFGIYRVGPAGGANILDVLLDDGWNNEFPGL